MSSPGTFEPIEDYLRGSGATPAAWTTTALVFENETFPPPDLPTAFVFVEVYGTLYSQASIGSEPPADNLWRENGMLWLHVMVTRGSGTRLARTYAKQLADLFRGQTFSGIRFRDASIGASEPGDQDGNYTRMSVSVEWERDD